MIFGLIGREISYSFSKGYFTLKFSQENRVNEYQNFDLENLDAIQEIFATERLKGLNVTIPYKEEIMAYLDEIEEEAKAVGAVNTIKFFEGKTIGYNTDIYGFKESLVPLLKKHHKKALIFGNGGAAKAVKYVLNQLDIEFISVERNGAFTYKDLHENVAKSHSLWINTTPVGTHPNIDEHLDLPFQFLNQEHLVFDLIYNPVKSKLLQIAETKGASIKNGFEMLELQAEKSWKIWNA